MAPASILAALQAFILRDRFDDIKIPFLTTAAFPLATTGGTAKVVIEAFEVTHKLASTAIIWRATVASVRATAQIGTGPSILTRT
mmetsp:Transcript_9101/g.18598  ORF Transcript_9101/g.18598 Transcript_9101/m.18598 type:complete len:85 (-) Transcript_9101:1007-1261(-)